MCITDQDKEFADMSCKNCGGKDVLTSTGNCSNCGEDNKSAILAVSPEKQPYTCPVCIGNGQVMSGFYTNTGRMYSTIILESGTEKCRSCGGSGFVWG